MWKLHAMTDIGKRCRLLLAVSAVTLFGASPALTAENADQRAAARADEAYAAGSYATALKQYLRLAKKGDPFSQYRSSYMHLKGEGVEPDYPIAFAWAVLAAESGDPQLASYLGEVKALVPIDLRDEAQRQAEAYLREWGRVALAIEARRKVDRELRNCTGSRLGTRCEEVYAMQMPKFWSVRPGDGSGDDGGGAARSGTVSSAMAGAGGEVRDAAHYEELRAYSAELDRFIEQNAGNVELGEFKVIEEESEGASIQDDG